MTRPGWLVLGSALPADRGECIRTVLPEGELAGWETVQFHYGDGINGLRVAMVLRQPDGAIAGVSDLVAWDQGRHQETALIRVDLEAGPQGTHWETEGEQHTPRPVTAEETAALLRLAEDLLVRS